MGDLNGHSTLWGSGTTDRKGALIEDFVTRRGLVIINDPHSLPTFQGSSGTSHIDLTMVSVDRVNKVMSWDVLQDWTSSDHCVLRTIVHETAEGECYSRKRWCTRKVDEHALRENIAWHLDNVLMINDLESRAIGICSAVVRACDQVLPFRKVIKRTVPWWTKELSTQKRLTYRARRTYQRAKDPQTRLYLKNNYLSMRTKFHDNVKVLKKRSWQEFIERSAKEGPWGLPYKMAQRKYHGKSYLQSFRDEGGSFTKTSEEAVRKILEHCFPKDDANQDSPIHTCIRQDSAVLSGAANAPNWDDLDVEIAIESLKNNKSPGPDLIDVNVVKKCKGILAPHLTNIYNRCLNEGYFPQIWKVAEVVAIPKRDERNAQPGGYRAICLLSVIGKIMEKLIVMRLLPKMTETISPHQFGGVKGRSTTGAMMALQGKVAESTAKYVLGVFADISGAFDNLWWPTILKALKNIDCPANLFNLLKSYLEDRKAFVALPSGRVWHRVETGCPQGSVLGPFMWNLVFDSLLNELTTNGFTPVAFVDDLAVVIEAQGQKSLKEDAERAINILITWCSERKLSLNAKKTKILLLKNRIRQRNAFKVKMADTYVSFSDEVKYLGVTYGERLNPSPHLRELKENIIRRYGCLLSIARNTWGLNTRNRVILYKALYLPIVSYAAPAWFPNLNKRHISLLVQTQRKALLMLTRTYKTVSTDALHVLAGQLPVDLELGLSVARYNIPRGLPARVGTSIFTVIATSYEEVKPRMYSAAVSQWQERWHISTKGRTTYKFMPDVRKRLEMEWLHLDFYTAQLLSGHGDINHKLHYFSLRDNPNCKCGAVENVEHIVLDCPNYARARIQLAGEFSILEWPPSSFTLLLETEEVFSAFKAFAGAVFKAKSRTI